MTEGPNKAEFKMVNAFDEWLDIREVKDILMSLKVKIYRLLEGK